MSNLKQTKTIVILLLLSFTIFSCNKKTEKVEKVEKTEKTEKVKENSEIIFAASLKSDCDRIKSNKCILIKEINEYDKIEGFTPKEDFDYLLKIEETTIKNPMMDSSSVKYKLIKIVSKKKHICKKNTRKEQHLMRKPILYLYPQKDMKLSIKLQNSDNIIHSYPKYPENGWEVNVKKDGTIIYNNRKYYSLYWEMNSYDNFDFDEGFIVKKDNIVSFLERSLKMMGLNFKESQEFIIYWLPILEQNELNLIKFETSEYNKKEPIEISPKPDTLIRIMMLFKPIDSTNILIKEQTLPRYKRVGFTVVEWGGTKI